MAGVKGMKRKTTAPEGGQHPDLATQGRARATGNLDVIRPGDPDYGKSSAKPHAKGLRVESEKGFQLSEDHDPTEMVRVFDKSPDHKDADIVLFSGTRRQLQNLVAAGGTFLKK